MTHAFLLTGKPNKWAHYFDIYHRHFERFRNTEMTIIEIGVFGGGSLTMWKAYFGEQSQVVGIDIKPECKQHEADGIEVFIGNQADPDLIDAVFKKHPKIDIVLDDGSHRMEHQIASFNLMYHRLQPHGIYMVEDTHTSYKSKYGGGLNKDGTFIETVKPMIDLLHANFSDEIPATQFAKTTESISFYDSIVVFERKPQEKRFPIKRTYRT